MRVLALVDEAAEYFREGRLINYGCIAVHNHKLITTLVIEDGQGNRMLRVRMNDEGYEDLPHRMARQVRSEAQKGGSVAPRSER
jgi:hypothetical protein